MLVLVADDDRHIAGSLKKGLDREGYRTIIANNGQAALEKANTSKPDVILLDWRMPKLSGFEVCRGLRAEGNNVPIIMLTALSDISNKIDALKAGADDYITKPFSFDELLARIHAVLRRASGSANELTVNNLRLVLLTRELYHNDNFVKLPDMEFELLRYLILKKNTIVNKEQLCREVWKLSFQPDTNFVEVTMKNLRNKLKELTAERMIKTIYGEGYILIED